MEKLFKYIHKIIIQLFVLVFLGIGNGANAQYPYDFSFAGIPFATKTIVRHYDNERVVVYYEENGNGYVSLVNVISNDAYTVPLNTGYFMNDMCILNDSVFLCGYETDIYAGSNYKIGTIVTMYLNNFYTTNVHVTYFEPSYWMNVDLKRIKQYEYTYATSNRAKLLLVGDIYYPCDSSTQFPIYDFRHYYTDLNNHSMCMVNAVWEVSYPFYTSFSSAGPLQKVIRVMNPFEHSEVIHDVVVTDNYVAFVGVASGTIDTITLHICSKDSDVLKSDYTSNPPTLMSDFDNYYTYSLGTGSGSPFYHACALDGDMIAIVTQDEMSTSSTDITIRTFDLTTHTMTNTQYLQCYSHPELKMLPITIFWEGLFCFIMAISNWWEAFVISSARWIHTIAVPVIRCQA